jgi:Peptidase propeptide and YPEB domain
VERGEAERQLKKCGTILTLAAQHANALGLNVVTRARPTALLACLLCAAAGAGAALVTAAARHPDAVPFAMPRGNVSMDQAVRMVEERYHARVVKAETQQDAGHTLYVLRLLNDEGKVWTVRVDAASGSVQ